MTPLLQAVRQCAWCCRVVDMTGRYGVAPVGKIKSATHGICPTCKELVRSEIDGRVAPTLLAA
jgi:hypothetical protein